MDFPEDMVEKLRREERDEFGFLVDSMRLHNLFYLHVTFSDPFCSS